MPMGNLYQDNLGVINLFFWPVFALLVAAIGVAVYCRYSGWSLFNSELVKGRSESQRINISNLDWVLYGKPKNDLDEKRYNLTEGSSRHQFWKVIDNTICLKTKDGSYLMLNIHFFNRSKPFLKFLKESIDCREVSLSDLNIKELKAFKFGDYNNVFRL